MLPQSKPSFFETSNDAELEWLLCLASALQARHNRPARLAAESHSLPEPRPKSGRQDPLKGRRWNQRISAA